MIHFLRLVAAVMACIWLTTHSSFAQTRAGAAEAANIDAFFTRFTEEWIRHDPDLARRTRLLSGEEQDRLERQMTPRTLAQKRENIVLAKRGLSELGKFDRSHMSEAERLSADVMAWQLQAVIDEEPFLDFAFPLEQFRGANVSLVNAMVVTYPVLVVRDAENYVAALGQVSGRMKEAVAEAQRLAKKGIVPPRFILKTTIEQMKVFIEPAPVQNPMVAVFSQKMAAIKDMPAGEREKLAGEAEAIVRNEVYPAWREAIAVLEAHQAAATDEPGLWRLKGGQAAYANMVRRHTTTLMTPDQIHEIGLRQVGAIDAKKDELLRKIGRTEGSVSDRIAVLKRDLGYANASSEEARSLIMKDVEDILRDAERRAVPFFAKTPKTPIVARPSPKFQEATAAASYSPPNSSGTRPGIFQIPLRPEQMTKFALRTLVYHEGVPGHHFDIAQQVENKDLPVFRQVRAFGGSAARSEGWGLYAERLAVELGWYGDDIEGMIGQLDEEQFRARRLVVDTGLHSKHWTRQQAIDYGIEAAEVERYVVFPGQALAYMVGQLKIFELRDKAKKALGDRFSLKDFHAMVLDTGDVPLEILERQTDAFIARTKTKS